MKISKILKRRLKPDVVTLNVATGERTPPVLLLVTNAVRINWGMLFKYKG
jgi:hypothetical protein